MSTHSLFSSVAVMAASPEGKLYYWADAFRDTSTVTEGSADVGNGYSFMLAALASSRGCVLATTQGSLFHVSTNTQVLATL